MEYPILNVKPKSRQMLDIFLGYNHNMRIADGEFYDMQNMTSDYYPVLASRRGRGVYKEDANAVTGILAKDKLCFTEGSAFVIGSERIEMELNAEPKDLVSMGAYVIILPDKKWINITPKDGVYEWGEIEHQNSINTEGAMVYYYLCDAEGAVYTDDKVRPGEKPVEADGNLWLDTDTVPPVLKRYSDANAAWMVVPITYLRIEAKGIGTGFLKGDGIEISGIENPAWENLNGIHTLAACGEDHIVITGMPNNYDQDVTEPEDSGMITISRKIPAMDFIIECNNRLWGCRYGPDNKGNVVNEIYASKLGDFKNWTCFTGISTDSYAVSCGTDGPFTGAINHGGYPLFFKENCVHKVYGDYPANFRVQSTVCRGVQKGSHNSLAIVGDTLFYKSRDAVCAYDGGLPVVASSALGEVYYSNAVACALGNKYYINMKDAQGQYHLFVFDTAKGMWHREDSLQVRAMCAYGGEIYAITPSEEGNKILMLLGSGGSEENVEWMVETGLMGMSMPESKYISRLLVRLSLGEQGSLRISIQYDSAGEWLPVYSMETTTLRSCAIPILPRRCDHFRLRIEGQGICRIYSITKTIEQGSDVP